MAIVAPKTTKLSKKDEEAYRTWLKSIGHTKEAGFALDDAWSGTDYDYRGFFKKYGGVLMDQGQHFTDEFKLPLHPSFSDESIYFNELTKPFAGHWNENRFEPFDPRFKGVLVE